MDRLWDERNRVPILIWSAGLTALIAFADWWTLPYVSLGFLYLFPILLAAGFLPRPAILAMGLLCALLSEAFSSLDAGGRISRLIFESLALGGSGLFVSELLRNRRLTQMTRERLRALVETSPAAIVTADQDGIIDLANGAAAELLSPHGKNLQGRSIGAFVPDLGSAIRLGGQPRFRTSMQCAAHRDDGEEFAAEIWFSTYRQNSSQRLAAIIADITAERVEQLPVAAVLGTQALNGADSLNLNERQSSVLRLVLEGNTNADIAIRLDLSASAVKNTLQQLFHKTRAKNRSQLVGIVLNKYAYVLEPLPRFVQSDIGFRENTRG